MFRIRLKELRENRNISQYKLAEDLGISQSTVGNWEAGKREPGFDMIIKLSNYFGMSVDYLLGRDVPAAQPSNIYEVNGLVIYEELGTVCAGFDGSVDEIPTGRKVEIPASMICGGKKEDYFVLRVKGNSMYPRLLEGDTILCKRCESVDSGSLAVVLYNGDEATIKKVNYVNGENWLELIPINPEYPTKRIEGADLEQCRILGLVVKLIRDL